MDETAIEQSKKENDIYVDLKGVYNNLKFIKPNDRSEKDRSFAVVITDLEKLLAYYSVYILRM